MRASRLLLLAVLAPSALLASSPAPKAAAPAAPSLPFVPAVTLGAPAADQSCWVRRCIERQCVWVAVC